MGRMLAAIRSLIRGEEGATIVEYALLIALIALVCITAVLTVGTLVSGFFNAAAGSI